MRKNLFGRQFKRDTNERKSLFKSLLSALVLEGRIKTTLSKAKAIKGRADRIITHAKKGKLAFQLLKSYLPDNAIEKVVSQIAPGFMKRHGGYTRIVKLGQRFSDRAAMVLLEWVEGEDVKKLEVSKVEKAMPAGRQVSKVSKGEKKVTRIKTKRKVKK